MTAPRNSALDATNQHIARKHRRKQHAAQQVTEMHHRVHVRRDRRRQLALLVAGIGGGWLR